MIKTGSLLAKQTILDLSHHTPHVKHPNAQVSKSTLPALLIHLQQALHPLSTLSHAVTVCISNCQYGVHYVEVSLWYLSLGQWWARIVTILWYLEVCRRPGGEGHCWFRGHKMRRYSLMQGASLDRRRCKGQFADVMQNAELRFGRLCTLQAWNSRQKSVTPRWPRHSPPAAILHSRTYCMLLAKSCYLSTATRYKIKL